MKSALSALVCGIVFGLGLTVSGMINPQKVIGFLDLTGNWDPSLALVMAGALVVTLIGYRVVLKGRGPLFDVKFRLPTRTDIDAKLIGGAALFGIGWGLSGLCPGPAIAGIGLSVLGVASSQVFLFLGAMLAGMLVARFALRTR